MSKERDSAAAPTGISSAAGGRGYHHGDLRNGLLEAARTILEEQSLAALTLRAVARKAGVSHAAPYRHFPNHEALLVELSIEGFDELREALAEAAKAPGHRIGHASPTSAPPICALWRSARRWRG